MPAAIAQDVVPDNSCPILRHNADSTMDRLQVHAPQMSTDLNCYVRMASR